MADRKLVIITEEQLAEQKRYMEEIRMLPFRPKTYFVVTYGCQMNAHDS